MDAATLNNALTTAAAFIHKNKENLTIIAVGGAVNCMALRSRTTTHDVDFFNARFGQKEYELLQAAAVTAQKKNKKLESAWLNNRTIFFIPHDLREALTDEAITQNDLVFEAPGLKVVAAPWHYAFCCKVDRIAGSGLLRARPYDVSDAAAYLDRYLSFKRMQTITKAEVVAWMTRFQLQRSASGKGFDDICAVINQKLSRKAIV